jgi:hypothetical protein
MNPDRTPRSCALLLAALLVAWPFASLPAAAPLAQDYTVVYHNADPECFVEGPGLVRLYDGGLLAVVPVVPREQWSEERRVDHGVVHLLHSADGGKSWQARCDLPYYSAAPWLDRGALYLFASKPRPSKRANAELVLLRSADEGRTWAEPVTLGIGDFWISQTAMIQRDRRLYWALDDLNTGYNGAPRLVAGDLSGDPMKPGAWRISEAARIPKPSSGSSDGKFAEPPIQHVEPNVIEVNGQLRLLAAMRFKRPQATGLCAVLDATDDAARLGLKFHHFSALPGGQLKSCLLRDEISGMFWATSNLPAESEDLFGWAKQEAGRGRYKAAAGDRRFLMLSYGLDGLNWFPAGCVAQGGRLAQSFMDARPVIDGDDLAIIARASIHGPNQQDADDATFHRVRDFRGLALKLHPEAGGE